MKATIYFKQQAIKEFADEAHAKAFLPILKAQDRRANIKRNYHIRVCQ